MVRDVFRTRNMRALPGNLGLGQNALPHRWQRLQRRRSAALYVNAPFGLVLAHNGNLTNAQTLKTQLFTTDHRHINTDSDSEVLLNVLAHELERSTRGLPLNRGCIYCRASRAQACAGLLRRCSADRWSRPARLSRPPMAYVRCASGVAQTAPPW